MSIEDEIIELALRYISEDDMVEFPRSGELFSLMERDIPDNKILKEDEGWEFNGYGICQGYSYDDEQKPHGKWIWFHFISLSSFPPVKQSIQLQPPHIAKGCFSNPTRTIEIRIVTHHEESIISLEDLLQSKLPEDQSPQENIQDSDDDDKSEGSSNILTFPKKGD